MGDDRPEGGYGQNDEAFTRNLEWEHSSLLYSFERATLTRLTEISEDEANRIVERIRATVIGANEGSPG